MGVVIHVLERRPLLLDVGGIVHEVGALRRLGTVTGVGPRDEAAVRRAQARPSPAAALVVGHVATFPLSSGAGEVSAHPVIGWDKGRGRVSDLHWDFLPTLGHAVRDARHHRFVLHERLDDGSLRPFDRERAVALGLVDQAGTLVRHGQPVITECTSVEPYVAGFARASCVLAGVRHETLFVRIRDGALPPPARLVGRRPMDVEDHIAAAWPQI